MTRALDVELSDASTASPELGRKLVPFQKQRVINLESYKKNGYPKPTPVIFVKDNGKLYFQTAVKARKAKRVMRNPRVRVAPSTFRGKPKGDWFDATVVKVEGTEAKRIRGAFISKFSVFSLLLFFIGRLLWGKQGFFSISLDTDQSGTI